MEEKNSLYLRFTGADPRVKSLAESDETLGRLLSFIGTSELAMEYDGFRCLAKYIIGQQISDKARETIWNRFNSCFNSIEPHIVSTICDNDLRDLGLSRRKIEYIRNLSNKVVEQTIVFDKLKSLSNEEIILRLTQLKGIGRWTAEMYLIFSLGRLDVLPVNDGTIRRSLKWMYNLESLPTAEETKKYFANWINYSGIVAAFFWKSLKLGLQQYSFDEIISFRSG